MKFTRFLDFVNEHERKVQIKKVIYQVESGENDGEHISLAKTDFSEKI